MKPDLNQLADDIERAAQALSSQDQDIVEMLAQLAAFGKRRDDLSADEQLAAAVFVPDAANIVSGKVSRNSKRALTQVFHRKE
jgi:ABC-type transporter Mla subunit MlaD